jgi:hypothetical protein
MTTTDPYELDDLSNKFFGERRFEEATKSFILSAIYGSHENRDALAEIDLTSQQFFNSQNPRSQEAYSYYEETLRPKVIAYLKSQFAILNTHKDKPVKLFHAQ